MALQTLIHASPIDYVILVVYFAFVLGIGYMARHQISDSLDFFLSGRRLPAWVTGLAFVSANLGAVEIMGMSANGAQLGLPTLHYFWVGAVPAMLFLGVVMMPFYYGSGVRSVPEFMLKRFGPAAHLVNSLSFALAQLLIAGVNLYLLGSIVHALLGWPLWVALIVAAIIVLAYITFGGLSAAIYNEVLQFFVIIAGLLPMVLIGLHRVGGWDGLKAKITQAAAAHPDKIVPASEQLNSWPGQSLSGFDNPVLSVVGIVFGLGFVLGFGYWTTNFVEVQRAMASKSLSDARRTPIIGTFPKMLVPFVTVLPGVLAAVLVPEIAATKAGQAVPGGASGTVTYNDSVLYLIQDLLPNGLVGLAITGLLAAFMAGMAANISAFNTVFSVDIWQHYVKKDKPDDYYVKVGRIATVAASIIAIGTAAIASNYSNIMDYLQTLFGFFNAPLFATFILGMFWKRSTPAAGWSGLASGTLAAVAVWLPSALGVYSLSGQGVSFVAAAAGFVVDILVSVVVSLVTKPKPAAELVGLVYSETPKESLQDPEEKGKPWYKRTVPLAGLSLVLVIILNFLF
ncbi:MAG: sodium:solute symporter family protein [Acidipropionibacterium acidipropionici]|uniref:Na+/galactose cotransporter n=1 Tax=Acidipropionibacterium acidipropionici TaxID=1748 RepID=A0AAC9APN1_9ACTN|nr:sodium:solute symporter family protein [Acidipropionibacterium acidipropionici]AMS07122.1 Na+/galactose cotransporter [Acidipropionibacterium acidipropionici]AOZ48322.1 Na+/galactose cotransporter [Acidipropionibacterium acidipropionici]AZP39300.1 Na+/galactose cotransporter [Acidipropionibacterium acidipropionici]QCV96672.1 sodium/solute symporter [Acidipropionibacterium acidipropionici]